MKKTILFDLDGTLTDSGEGIMNCAKLALDTFHVPIPPLSTLRTIVGPPLDVSFRRLGMPEEVIDQAITVFRGRYSDIGKYENIPYPGIEDTLKKLKAQGHTLLVATSKPEVMALDIMDHFGLAPYFAKICGASLDRSRASKEAVIAYLIQEYGRDHNMVMVGDTEYDVIGAKAHGIPTIGVCWGYGDPAALVSSGAVALAHSMQELIELINLDTY